jgi:hypothetical protein
MFLFARCSGRSQFFFDRPARTVFAVNPEKIETRTFDPRDAAHRWNLWIRLDSHEGGFYRFFWGRICIVLAVGALAGWLAVAAGAWANAKYRRGISEARYLDLAAPWRWGRYRAAIGGHYLALGRFELEKGHPSAALNLLDASLALAPKNLESRRLAALAQYRLDFKPAALALLRVGVDSAADAGDEAYLRAFFDVAFDLQADDDAFAVGSRLLPQRPDSSRIHRFIAFQVATARYNRGRYLETERILADWRLQDFPEGDILLARCRAERGMREDSIRLLEGDLARFTQRDGIYVALEGLAREQGLPQAVRRYALLRGIAEPERPQARVDLLYADRALDRAADVRREIDSYCADFKSDPDALTLLSQFAADTGEPDTAERARDLASAGGIPIADFDVRVAQASLVAKDYRRAIRAVTLAQTESQSASRAYVAILAGIKAVSLFGAGDNGAQLAFSDFLPLSTALRPPAGLFLVRQLRRMGLADEGREVLEQVCSENPDDQPALAELIRSDAAAGNRTGLDARLPRFLKMRKPPRDVLEACLPWLDPAKDAALRLQVAKALADSPSAPSPNGL